ncbi:hypothetical protein Arub01_23850 [Actinomadura rubrobrunea]|uniref:Tetratricopeptide repeat protein n=1 Tax=Actinomadura rubrobrunea TaxID=115335 RepID=A0A9W6UTZ3_9ACTN|nr:hypothetical protein Arub01_23850 [Actinomadura rubrobrunea]
MCPVGRGIHHVRGRSSALVRAAEEQGDWDTAISLIRSVAECDSPDDLKADAHLWHMDLLARAGRLDELATRGETDRHAQRRLDRLLYEEDRDSELRHRALHGDKYALYLLVRLLRERGEQAAAQRAVAEIDETNAYAWQLANEPSAR